MSSQSVLNICNPKVIKCLADHVNNSEATQQYLRLMYMTLYAVLQEDLEVEKRLYYLWYTAFFLRIWRAWIIRHEEYTLQNNFISLNNYICIEINAHGMYNLILKHINRGNFEGFNPYMSSSQPCESLYRY